MNENIVPHKHEINRKDRERAQGHRAICIWFTGLSGSGKSTLANALEQELFGKGLRTYILDGDNIRAGINRDLGFDPEDREENIRRIGEVAKLMVDAGCITLSAFVSPYERDRARVRSLFAEGEFVEVFVDCPFEVCAQRDVKGLYAKAKKGQIKNFTGLDSPFEVPKAPEAILKTDEEGKEVLIRKVIALILPLIYN